MPGKFKRITLLDEHRFFPGLGMVTSSLLHQYCLSSQVCAIATLQRDASHIPLITLAVYVIWIEFDWNETVTAFLFESGDRLF